MSTKKIIQIIPCPHELYAEYKDGDERFTTKIVCLALVETTNRSGDVFTTVEGVDCELDEVQSNGNFVGYRDTPIPK